MAKCLVTGHKGYIGNKIYNSLRDVGTGRSIVLNEIKDIVDYHHQPKWNYVPERKGDVKHTLADINKLKNIGWCAKINVIDAINNCFEGSKT